MLIFTSPPKAGTHLVHAVLTDLLGPAGAPLTKHAPWAPRAPWTFCAHIRYQGQPVPAGARVLVLVRDPRAIVLSMRDFAVRPPAATGLAPSIAGLLSQLSYDDQIRTVADGIRTEDALIGSIDRHCSGYVEWPGATILKYEELFTGAAAAKLAVLLEPVSAARVQKAIARAMRRRSRTFNVGAPDRWRSLPPELIAHIEDRAAPAMELFGYERYRRGRADAADVPGRDGAPSSPFDALAPKPAI